jgi:hypothetical protein
MMSYALATAAFLVEDGCWLATLALQGDGQNCLLKGLAICFVSRTAKVELTLKGDKRNNPQHIKGGAKANNAVHKEARQRTDNYTSYAT